MSPVRAVLLLLVAALAVATGCDGDSPQELELASSGSPLVPQATATLLKDIAPSHLSRDKDSSPEQFTTVGNTTFFVAYTSEMGAELWKTNAITGNTELVKDIYPGLTSSTIQELTAAGSTVFFIASEPGHGRELWKSDGTAAGTVMVKELTPGSEGTSLSNLTEMGGMLYFVAETASLGSELWKSDGTSAGTVLVKDIYTGTGSASPQNLTAIDGTLYFQATTSGQGAELWKSDGTSAGTVLLKDIHPNGFSNPYGFTRLGSGVVFFASNGTLGDELWRTDGTSAGTVLVKDIYPGNSGCYALEPTAVGGTVFFEARDGTNGHELWKTDGTAAGTVLVKDITPGSSSSSLSHLTAVGSTLFFVAEEPTWGKELWKSDGTEAGTVLVKDIQPGTGGSHPENLTAFGGHLYFSTLGGTLQRSDGTAAGTFAVRTANPYPWHVRSLVATGGWLYFNGEDQSGREPWKSDGTAANTVRVKDVQTNPSTSDPRFLTPAGDKVFFFAGEYLSAWELYVSDGTTAGTQRVSPHSIAYIPRPMATLNGTAFFEGYSSNEGQELWKSAGTLASTQLVLEINPNGHAEVEELTPMGSTVFFKARHPVRSKELWKTDGTAAGTTMVPSASGVAIYDPRNFMVMNGVLYFSADTSATGYELWRSDGTAAGTAMIKGLSTGIYSPLGVMGNALYFKTETSSQGTELWKTDGTAAGTVLVKDIYPGSRGSAISHAVVMGGALYFQATTSGQGAELWKSDGTAAGTVLLKDIQPGTASSSPRHLTVVNNLLFFGASTPNEGYELWVSDGTAAGTVLLRDLSPGTLSGLSSEPMLALGPEGLLVFTATDGTTGMEPWVSDGTAAGTLLLQDLAPGARGSVPGEYVRAGNRLFFFAEDDTHGREPWVRPLTDLADTTPPTVTCPASVVVEATGPSGATVMYPPASGTDNNRSAGLPTLAYSHPSGGTFPVGLTPVTVTATDKAGNTATCSFQVTVRDTVAPTVTCPASLTTEATSASGAPVPYPAATASDAVSTPTLAYSKASGSTFALGTTTVTATASDAAGNSTSCTFQVTVRDTTAPTLACPADVTAEATGTTGAAVSYPPATASDAVSAPTLSYSWAAGSTFPMGTNTVTASASDAAGNSTTCTFKVTVRDSTPPVLLCPANVTAEATSPSGATVTYPLATVSDAVTASPTVAYSKASGTAFPLGGTAVKVTAVDNSGNSSTCSFAVTVQDTVAPTLTCPANLTREATGPSGATVTYPPATASDAITSSPQVSYSHASGTAFALGTTQVTVKARDSSGNEATCGFSITVQDTVAPTLSCPADLTVEATSASGTPVTYPAATASDTVTPSPALSYSHASGSTFPLGNTLVTVTATDTAGNAATCSLRITVRDTTAPTLSCPAPVTAEASDASGAQVTYPVATSSDAVTSSPQVSYSQASGTRFPLGTTSVTVTAKDAAGNTATCSFNVLVRDTTAPTLTCPAHLTVEATSSAGAQASFPAATVSDAVTTSPGVQYSHVSGSTFPLGATPVTVTATDAAGNSATCAFSVTVRDTVAPTLSCPAHLTVEATGPAGATVAYPAATASDRISSVSLGYSHPSGGTFPVGATAVSITATDAAGNSATCAFNVIVRDSVAPTLTCPASLTTEATLPTGAGVTYPSATGSDAISQVTLSYSQASGATFPLGNTVVTVTAADASGNTTTCHFTVRVQDTTAPTLTCNSMLVEATSGTGAPVTFTVTAQDTVTAEPSLSYNRASGAVLPPGTTPITATATDKAGNQATCSFSVTVQDTTAPTLTCPADVTTQAPSTSGALVTYPPATASDAVTALPALTYSQASGTLFPVGTTSVTAAATDSAGNHATCAFQVIVQPPPPPPDGGNGGDGGNEPHPPGGGCGCTSAALGDSSGWVALAGLALVAARRRRSLARQLQSKGGPLKRQAPSPARTRRACAAEPPAPDGSPGGCESSGGSAGRRCCRAPPPRPAPSSRGPVGTRGAGGRG
jgi:MYXO-CTERM domain-containing protein